MKKSRSKIFLGVGLGTVTVAIICAVTIVLVGNSKDDGSDGSLNRQRDFKYPLSPPSNTPLGSYSTAAVSCDAIYCSDIAIDILRDGGNVADATVGGLLCMGVIASQSMGIGGGFLLTMYNATTKVTRVLNAREMAPAAATEDMFEEHPGNSTRGGLAVAIPGEMKGYWELHQAHGLLPWARLLEPTIDLCENGFNVTKSAANAMASNSATIKNEPSLAEIFLNPGTGEVWTEGDVMTRRKLARTLRTIATNGGNAFYEGQIVEDFIRDLKSFGGIMTVEDLRNYSVFWGDPIELDIYGGYKLKTIPPPGSGVLVGFMLGVLGGHIPPPTSLDDYATSYQRIMETFKYAYARRTVLGDPADDEITDDVHEMVALLKSPEYATEIRQLLMDTKTNNSVEYYGAEFDTLPDDHGTAHFSIVDANGDAIAVTSTINLSYGAKIRSSSTGVIFNNEMDDFSSPNTTNEFGLPPSVNNFIKPWKRPMSSMSPSIFTDENGRVQLVVGAAGGTRITTATTLVSIFNLWFGMNIKEAMDERRIHHQLFPMQISYEEGFNTQIMNVLASYGHNVTRNGIGGSVAGGVARTQDGTLQATYDFRKSGSIGGY